jgi:hypothetical protein
MLTHLWSPDILHTYEAWGRGTTREGVPAQPYPETLGAYYYEFLIRRAKACGLPALSSD